MLIKRRAYATMLICLLVGGHITAVSAGSTITPGQAASAFVDCGLSSDKSWSKTTWCIGVELAKAYAISWLLNSAASAVQEFAKTA